jgi:hypothetical protein
MPNLKEHRKIMKSSGNQAGNAFMRYAPLEIKREFVDGNFDAALAGLKRAIEGDSIPCQRCGQTGAPEPWALRAWLEAAGVVGSMQQVIIQLTASLGVRDETEARALIESGREAKRLAADATSSLADFESAGCDLLQSVLKHAPERRAAIAARLGLRGVLVESTQASASGASGSPNGSVGKDTSREGGGN